VARHGQPVLDPSPAAARHSWGAGLRLPYCKGADESHKTSIHHLPDNPEIRAEMHKIADKQRRQPGAPSG